MGLIRLVTGGVATLALTATAAAGLATTASAEGDAGVTGVQGFWGVEASGLTWDECYDMGYAGLRSGRWTNFECDNDPPEHLAVTLYVYYA